MKYILLADDHQVVRKGLMQILTDAFGEVNFGEASSGAEAYRLLRERKWDILILDVNMPGRNGLEILKQIKDEKICVPVLVLSMHPEEQIAIRAMRMGACGYLTKDSADKELINAVSQIISGRKYITTSLAEQMASQLENPQVKALHEHLSDREYQTLLLFANGKTVSQIATELSLSVHTISTFRSRILEKMNMKNTAELIAYTVRNSLL